MSDPQPAARPAAAWLAAAAVLLALAVWMRIHNAFAYVFLYGFDAPFNWEYVQLIEKRWVLPHPEQGWSTARPPLFFHLAGGLARLLDARLQAIPWIRIASSAVGLGAVALSAAYAWRRAPAAGARVREATLAAGLLLFLPAHIMLSAMVNEEILVASLTTLALYLYLRDLLDPASGRRELLRMTGVGLAAGLALLTKLTGLLTVAALVASELLVALRTGSWRPALRRGAVIGVVGLAVGSWFYARSLALYGYVYPRNLPAHEVMFTMPPGERGVLDYLRVPLATVTRSRLDDPALLHSVWGGTYATLWYDGQRHFLDANDPAVSRLGAVVLVLALLPTAALFLGMRRALLRALRAPRGPDAPMLLLTAISVAGYVFYTWTNPWYATVKGSYLLGLGLPGSVWAGELLAEWTRWEPGNRLRAAAVLLCLAALVVCVGVAFTFGATPLTLRPGEGPGLSWEFAPDR